MRIFGRGARRRLAPMLGGDRRRIELAFSQLFSLPGAPVFVYGDEIGLGDDLSQPGRSAVRPPMQWSGERNGGFSTADPEGLVQPAIADGPFSYREVNVAQQRGDPDSLFSRVRKLTRLRRMNPEIGRGAWLPVDTGDPAAFAHSYNLGGELLIAVHNFAGEPRKVALDLGRDEPSHLVDLMDGGDPILTAGRAEIDLGAYGYRWYKTSSLGK